MITGIPAGMELPWEIMKAERAIKELPWYSFLKRMKMKEQLAGMRMTGAIAGFHLALKDLEKAGIIKITKQ